MLIRSTSHPLFGILLRSFGKGASAKALVGQAKVCDEEGYHSVWAAERLLVPDPPNQDWSKITPVVFEELTLLSYVAAVTERVKLGTYVLLTPLRNPLVLLRQVTTLDVLSNCRVILGLGLGWMKEEFETSGVPISGRGKRTDDAIRFLRKVWTDRQPISYKSQFISMRPALFEPAPIQKPIPIWIGGMSRPALKRAGRSGDGWLAPNAMVDPEVTRRNIKTISTEARRHGRNPDEVTISCRLTIGTETEVPRLVRSIESLREMGVNLFIVDFGPYSAVDGDSKKIKAFSRDVMKSF